MNYPNGVFQVIFVWGKYVHDHRPLDNLSFYIAFVIKTMDTQILYLLIHPKLHFKF